ncbi:hypothetical protein TNCV_4410881 [Trichonephila clavipes]|nr:hypothetical protein TNCV_4410881 [Trichonephila clavipes]
MLPVYHLEIHHLLVIHRKVFRHFVETCILNIPVGTELQVNGGQPEYITNTFVCIKDGFLYNPLDNSHESHCFVSRYVSTGWILTREAMLDLQGKVDLITESYLLLLFMLHLCFIYEKFPVKIFEIKFIALKVTEFFLEALDECIARSRQRLYYYAILGISATIMGGCLYKLWG